MRVAIVFILTLFVCKGIAQPSDTVSVIGVGDIMMGTNFPDNSYLPPAGKNLFSKVTEELKDADVTFGNLEGVILDEGGDPKKCKNPKFCYLFRSPKKYLQYLVDAGFDVVSTANNHVNDFGVEGRVATKESLEKYGIPFAGFQTKPTTIFTIDSVTYGLAAFSPNLGTASMKNEAKAIQLVQELDSLVDIVILSIHTGAEGKDYQHVTKEDEIFLGFNRGNIYDFAHKMVDAGADIVFGHGPHVTRAVDYYKGRFIAYSLGNFCTYRRFNLAGPNGYAPILKVNTTLTGEFLWADVISVRQTPPGGPRIDPNNTSFNYIKQLTSEDIPEAELSFNNNQIRPKKSG